MAPPRTLILALTGLLALGPWQALSAQCPVAKLSEESSNDIDEFGWTMALDGDLLAVGEEGPDLAGSVHLFDVSALLGRGEWLELDEVQPSDSAPSQRFSEHLAVSGDTLVVGVPADGQQGSDAGAVYVFERDDAGTRGDPADDTWVETAKLFSALAPADQRFGAAVALAGDTLLVGAPGTNAAAAYVFYRDDAGTPSPLDDSWSQAAELNAVSPSTFSDFGFAVAVSADEQLLIVSDPTDASTGDSVGSGLAFGRVDAGVPGDPSDDTWSLVAELDLAFSEGQAGTIGRSVALSADSVALGAPFAGVHDFGGRVFVWDRDDQGTVSALDDTFSFNAELQGNPWIYGNFGESVAVDGERLAVPQRLWQFPPNKGTNVVVFERVGGVWSEAFTLEAPDRQVNDGVGGGVGLAGSLLVTGASGAEYDDDWVPAEGAAYAWDLDRAPTWDSDTFFLGDEHPVLGAWGSLEPGTRVGLRSYDHFGTVQAWFVLGVTRVDLPIKGGVLAPSPDVVLGPFAGDEYGSVTLEDTWISGVPVGTSLWFQSWAIGPGTFGDWRESQALEALTP